MIELREATASQEVPLGYFVDDTDGDTEETGLTIANTDILIWKNGATTLAAKNSGGATHISNGIYYAVLDATDTNTLGPMVIFVHVAGALTVRLECAVLPANVWDSRYSTDYLKVDAVQVEGADATDTILGALVDDATQIDASALNALTALAPASTIAAASDFPAADGSDFSLIPWNPTWDAEVQSECADALTAYDPPTKTELDNGFAALNDFDYSSEAVTLANGAHGGAAATFVLSDYSSFVGGAGASVEDIADAVWDEALSGHASAGSAGAAMSAAGSATGDGSVEVTEDYGGADTLRYVDGDGSGIDNGSIKVYLKSEYDAGTRNLIAQTNTDINGDFESSLWLDPGTYTFVYYKQEAFAETTQEVTVT